jgi:hypothetical protein
LMLLYCMQAGLCRNSRSLGHVLSRTIKDVRPINI